MASTVRQKLAALRKQLNKVLLADRIYARKEIQRLERAIHKNDNEAKLENRCDALEKRLEISKDTRRSRLQNRPVIKFDPDLPISAIHAGKLPAMAVKLNGVTA